MRLVLRETVPLWVLLHLDGPAGELMSWLNLRRLNPETCEIIPSVVFRIAADTSYQQYHVRLYGVDISKYAFVLRRYLRRAWTAFEQDAGKESDAPLFSDSTSTAPLDRSPSRYLGHRM
ncbi:MAG: hypothetical protein HYV02_08040 [Deltaproteobacteria bacterium]|nr:hypothetical protein [Deltaproteobacteria bacterium]